MKGGQRESIVSQFVCVHAADPASRRPRLSPSSVCPCHHAALSCLVSSARPSLLGFPLFHASVAGGSVAVQHLSDGNGINWKNQGSCRKGSEGGREAGQIQPVQVRTHEDRRTEVMVGTCSASLVSADLLSDSLMTALILIR